MLFFPAPDRDGTFSAAKGRDHAQPGSSIYRFVVDPAAQRAEFSLLEDPDVARRALATPQAYLRPVCEIRNESMESPRRILLEERGKAVLAGERWVVTDKAKVTYA